jgi:hypothetical protein
MFFDMIYTFSQELCNSQLATGIRYRLNFYKKCATLMFFDMIYTFSQELCNSQLATSILYELHFLT